DSERLLLVASDRISTFDVVLPTEIPDKGRVLTGLSAFWFARTCEIVPNHLLALRADGRSTECRRLEMLPLECVVRGYLTGSGWKDYHAPRAVCAQRPAAPPTSSPSRSSHPRRRRRKGTTRTSTASKPLSSSARNGSTRSSRCRSSSTASPPRTRPSAAFCSPTPSSSSGWTRKDSS